MRVMRHPMRPLACSLRASVLALAAASACSSLSPLLDSAYASPAGGSAAQASAAAAGGEIENAAALPRAFVDCSRGSDTNSGASRGTALRTLPRAIATGAKRIEVEGGVCRLREPLRLDSRVVLHGDGKTALSGGQPIDGWRPSPDHPGGKVMVADVADFPLPEIKMLRIGATSLRRSRWPKRVGDGLSTANYMFAMPWSAGSSGANRSYTLHQLGIDPRKLPARANLSHISGTGFVHVLGCIEKDVNSQLTRVLSIGGSREEPTAAILFRGTFTVNQRYYFENVGWELEEGEFFHDAESGRLYAWPPAHSPSGMTRAVAPVTDQLLEIRGSGSVVSNLTFLDTTYYSDGYWDGPAQQPSDAAVRINFAEQVSIESCNFLSSLGGYGVGVGNRTSNSSIVGCLFDRTGQGGVLLYGYDYNPRSNANGAVAGNNTKPSNIEVAHNVINDIGQVLVHVAGVGLRSASGCHVHHNRIAGSPRYGLQADSFYLGEGGGAACNSRYNVFEYNVISDTCRATSDCGAVEMIGSGDPVDDGPDAGWYSANTLRYNNITNTVGSSSSDGKTVCVHGLPAGPSCRGLVWGVYLDGGQAGITIHGNVIGATLHGAVFDNAGGNNSQTNNIFVAGPESGILMDFGAPATSSKIDRSTAGNVMKRNIFYWYGNRSTAAKVYASQVKFTADFLKPNGSDYNLFFSPDEDAASAPVFPIGINLSTWQGRTASATAAATCSSAAGVAGELRISPEGCKENWKHNGTTEKLLSDSFPGYVVNLDCDGNYAHCSIGDTSTRICISRPNGGPTGVVYPTPEINNQGWLLKSDGTIRAVASERCLEVCYRGGAVGGCNGAAGSILQLGICKTPPSKYQLWSLADQSGGGPLKSQGSGMCVEIPKRGKSSAIVDAFDLHSLALDPKFVDAAPELSGNFNLQSDSPAYALGFQPIPKIEAPYSTCSDSPSGCLSAFLQLHQLEYSEGTLVTNHQRQNDDPHSDHAPGVMVRPLVKFDKLPYSTFSKLHFVSLPYTGGTSSALGATWVLGVSCCNSTSSGFFTEEKIRAASRAYSMNGAPLLTDKLECSGCTSTAQSLRVENIREWGYEFHSFPEQDPQFRSQPCVSMTMATKIANGQQPRDRHEALSWMNEYYECRKRVGAQQVGNRPAGLMDLVGHYFYSGLGLERGGASVVASEIQENINSIQFHLALTRGAARQFHLPWAVDVSPWFEGFITDYSDARPWKSASASGGAGGHSLSLFRRSWWLSYLSGANHLIIEAGGLNLFYQNLTAQGVYSLSPLGVQARELANFTSSTCELQDRATPYVPVAIVLPHAHGYGLGLVDGPSAKAWNFFPLTGTDRVAWLLIQNLFPGSWKIKSKGADAESNYLVPSPYGDIFDILNERGSIAALPLYRAVVFTGNVTLGDNEVSQLQSWIQKGGTAMVFASQFQSSSQAVASSFLGAILQRNVHVALKNVSDIETGWHHATDSSLLPHHGVQAPFCVPQSTRNSPPYYIKTGGDPQVKVGWDNGDRCCRVNNPGGEDCYWFASLVECEVALRGPDRATCLPCRQGCNITNNGCPSWTDQCPSPPPPPAPLGLTLSRLTTAHNVMLATTTDGKPTPVVLRNTIGTGTVITVLLEDNDALDELKVIPHLLSRMASDLLPFQVLSADNTTNLLESKLQLLLARRSVGWQLTLVNNNGVTKQPSQAAVVDPSQRVIARIQLKPGYGTVVGASRVSAHGETRLKVSDKNEVTVEVEAGDLTVVRITVEL